MPRRHRSGTGAHRGITHIEEIILATSGEDAFELIFAVAAARVAARRDRTKRSGPEAVSFARLKDVAHSHPELEIELPRTAAGALLARVDALLTPLLDDTDTRLPGLDAVFESLVPRVAKGDKGQFFTPRHVVDFVIRVLAPRAREIVVDPACGSGAFLAHARAEARVQTYGSDVDPRAVRVARLVALAQGRSLFSVVRADGLRQAAFPPAHVVATNPPFAGRADATGFSVDSLVRSPERDVLFLERSLELLRPGGRLGIVLPYNKAASAAFDRLRVWLVSRARIFGVVSLPRETFLPYTSQRTFLLFAKRRGVREVASAEERVAFFVSERSGKTSAGEPILRRNGELDHDLEDVYRGLGAFLRDEGWTR